MRTGVSSALGAVRKRWSLAACVALLALAASSAADAVQSTPPTDNSPTVAYVTETAKSPATVWTVRADGTDLTRVGPGDDPLIAPSGQQVAASLFGTGAGLETGPALAIYWNEASGRPPLEYFNLAHETAQPLAWSRDLRYVAVAIQSTAITNTAQRSGLAIVDVGLHTVKMIAHGQIYGASFAPNGSDEVIYGRSSSQLLSAPVNVYRSKPDGTGAVALTRDGHSLFPLWGPHAIAYDRERMRRNDAPVYQIWLRSPTGSSQRRLTNIRVRTLVSGLMPLAFSANGRNLLAQFVGQDTSEAWTVRLPSGRAHRLSAPGRRVLQAAGLSGDGKTVLVNEGGDEGPASEGRVATLPFAGGRSKLLVAHGSQSSWNG
jgi:hypothetical protein